MGEKLSDLNNHLFAQLERLGDKTLDTDGMEREVKRTNAIVNVSEQVINNARISLSAAELVAKHGCGNWEDMLPPVENKVLSPMAKQKSLTGVPDYKNESIK